MLKYAKNHGNWLRHFEDISKICEPLGPTLYILHYLGLLEGAGVLSSWIESNWIESTRLCHWIESNRFLFPRIAHHYCPRAYLRNRTAKPTQSFVHVACGRGWVLLWRHGNVSHTSGFVDNVMFSAVCYCLLLDKLICEEARWILRHPVVACGGWEYGMLCREKEHLDVREAMQRQHITNEHKYSQAVKELQAKVWWLHIKQLW